MHLVPVLDLKRGQVVSAVGGDRARYRPSSTRLCADSDPAAVLHALLALGAFDTVYVADLDAIGGTGDNLARVRQLRAAFADVEFWLDRGDWHAPPPGIAGLRTVIGSESLPDLGVLETATRHANTPVLSLDYRHQQLLGPAELDARSDLWPDRLIVMSLDRVGTRNGPDLERLRMLRSGSAGHRRWYAAGGVRDLDDLTRLAADGIDGALVSTCLHQGMLTPEQIDTLMAGRH